MDVDPNKEEDSGLVEDTFSYERDSMLIIKLKKFDMMLDRISQ